MSSVSDFATAIESVYEAALEPERWPSALAQLAQFIGAPATHWCSGDPMCKAAYPARAGFISDGSFAGAWETTPYPQGAQMRRDQADALSRLLPHLQCAARMQLRLSELTAKRHAAYEALNALNHAIAIVDARSHVFLANRAAHTLLESADGISAGPHGLSAATANLTQQLRWLVEQAGGVGGARAAGGSIALERPSMKRALQALISPLSTDSHWAALLSQKPAAMILIVDPDDASDGIEHRLKSLFNLTPAEARVACAIGKGEALGTVARSLGVLPSTVRTHLHHVFAKTDTRRQAELVRLIAQVGLVKIDNR
jgi:DNA-binding CsgD family transcriptional regulator